MCEGNVLGWGISVPFSNNVLIQKYGHLWQSICLAFGKGWNKNIIGRDTRLNIHNLSVKIVGVVCEGNVLGWGVSRFLSQKILTLQIWPPLTVNLFCLLLRGWMGQHNSDGNGRDTRLNVHHLSVKVVSSVRRQCFGLGVSRFYPKNASFNNQFSWPFARGCMSLHNNDGKGQDIRINVHSLSVKIVADVQRQYFGLTFIQQCTAR